MASNFCDLPASTSQALRLYHEPLHLAVLVAFKVTLFKGFERLSYVVSFLGSPGPGDQTLAHQTCCQVPYPTESSHHPLTILFVRKIQIRARDMVYASLGRGAYLAAGITYLFLHAFCCTVS